MAMNFNELGEFSKDFKRLGKKYLSLPDDLVDFKKVVAAVPTGTSKHFNVIIRRNQLVIVKARFFCRYLKGSSLRIIYAYRQETNSIVFIEMYFKGNKPNEDRERIKQYLNKFT